MPIPLYPDIVLQNDLSPDHGGSEIDELCQQIHDATKGWGADKQKVIDALATQDATRRTQMAIRYKELFNIELYELMKKEFSGDFGTAMKFLALPPDQAECAMIRQATKGIGASANIIWSIMIGRTNEELDILKKTYFKMYTKDLGKLLASELHGNMERLVFNSMQAAQETYDPQFHTDEKATEEAEIIRKSGQEKWGTDEKSIFKIICAAPPEHLENINKIYSDKYGYTLPKVIEKELSGNVCTACLHMLGMKLKPYETMATLVKTACAGFGTDEMLLTCTLIRYQGVMQHVMTAHIELFSKSIHARVRSETSGKYKDLLLQILNTVWPEQG